MCVVETAPTPPPPPPPPRPRNKINPYNWYLIPDRRLEPLDRRYSTQIMDVGRHTVTRNLTHSDVDKLFGNVIFHGAVKPINPYKPQALYIAITLNAKNTLHIEDAIGRRFRANGPEICMDSCAGHLPQQGLARYPSCHRSHARPGGSCFRGPAWLKQC